MRVNVMDRIMSTSITLFDQTFNANNVDIWYLYHFFLFVLLLVLFLPCGRLGGEYDMGSLALLKVSHCHLAY